MDEVSVVWLPADEVHRVSGQTDRSPAAWPGSELLTFLNFSFHIFKAWIIIAPTVGGY